LYFSFQEDDSSILEAADAFSAHQPPKYIEVSRNKERPHFSARKSLIFVEKRTVSTCIASPKPGDAYNGEKMTNE